MDDRKQSEFICKDCDVVFEVFTYFGSGRKYCPKCGDYMAVTGYHPEVKKGTNWTDKEIEFLEQWINGDIKLYTLMRLIKRTKKAIESKRTTHIKKIGMRNKYELWTDAEKELVDQCIAGKMNRTELSEILDKDYETVRMFVYRRKMKKSKENQEETG